MSDVEWDGDGFVVDAALLSAAFELPVSMIKALMREGRITSISEKGEGEDQGRWRITFYYGKRMMQLTLNDDHTVRSRQTLSAPIRGVWRQTR